MKIDKRSYAPILIFAFNRFDKFKLLLDSLLLNYQIDKHIVYVFIDVSDNYLDFQVTSKIINYCKKKSSSFKHLNIIKRELNFGLKKNILNGIDYVTSKHKSFIVLEDDLVVSTFFVYNLNLALQIYNKNKDIWHINGYAPPMLPKNADLFKTQNMNCWGWASWSNKWSKLNRNKFYLLWIAFKNTFYLNKDNSNTFLIVILNLLNLKNTWAYMWKLSIIHHNGYCLQFTKSLVINNGLDSTGENCGSIKIPQKISKSFKLKIQREKIRSCGMSNQILFDFNSIFKFSFLRFFKKKLGSLLK